MTVTSITSISKIEEVESSFAFSQTDEAIRRYEENGEINHVVGSQSLLSQELDALPRSEAVSSILVASQGSGGESHTSMAKRLGLLTAEEEDEEEEEHFEKEEVSTPKPKPAPRITIRDTPIRESECFGSLLEAVQKITEDEHVDGVFSLQPIFQDPKVDDITEVVLEEEEEDTTMLRPPKEITPSPKKRRKSNKTGKSTKKNNDQDAQEKAKRAATLAEQVVADPEMAKKLLLSMALARENPRACPDSWPQRGAVVPEGFFWAHFPPLEMVLKKKMAEYYELSVTKCQSAQQQAFNNELVVVVRRAADLQGWTFDEAVFDDKSLRDRIRCYYKTHIQNAKKRLRTMIRNPTKRANARHLCEHLDLIESHRERSDDDEEEEEAAPPTRPRVMRTNPRTRTTSRKRKARS